MSNECKRECKTCEFFISGITWRDKWGTICVRNPPSLVVIPYGSHIRVVPAHPEPCSYHWCGEWQKRTTTQEPSL